MCGITGAVWTEPDQAVSIETLHAMTTVLAHRGPNDSGTYTSALRHRPPYDARAGVALGHRRLSVIDIAGGRQPMSNEDGTIWLVFNGEIYNYRDLQRRLEGAGHTFRTSSDTEAIIHLYEDEGVDCFRHLNGMFAIALWDEPRGQLVLARDRLGKKPLVYRHDTGRLLFASELKSLLAVPGVPREIDLAAIDAYLTYQYVPYPRTIFRGLAKLPPGHSAVYKNDRLTIQSFWEPDFNQESPIKQGNAVEQLRDLLSSSVKLRMRSDVPLGAFLSGGIDSSLIAALMQRESSTPIQTFTIGFPIPQYDEREHARAVAKYIGSDHHEYEVTPSALEILPKLVWHYGEPFADSSAIPTWYLSEMTRRQVTVALSGDGGDELFLGYSRYRAVALAGMFDALPTVRRFAAAKFWQRIPSSGNQKSRIRVLKRFSEALGMSPARRYLDWISIFNESRRCELYSEAFLAQLPAVDPFDFLASAWARAAQRDAPTTAALADLVTYLPCDLMTKVDIASMAHGLEVRQPFLDVRLVEWAAALPARYKVRGGMTKRILRDAFGDLIPASIWKRKKMGFGVPLDHWLRGELAPLLDGLTGGSQLAARGWFNTAAIQKLIDEHRQRRFDHSARLWSLLILEQWLRTWGTAS